MPIFPSFFVNKTGAYEIEQSLRFDGSSSFTRTNGTPDSTSVTTFSCWIKKATPSISSNQQLLGYGAFPYQSYINFTTGGSSYSDNLSVLTYANSITGYTYTNALLRDPNAWYHIVLKKNGTTVQWYVNGELQSTTQSGNNGSNTTWNGASVAASLGSGFKGYIAEAIFVDNQDLNPNNFGELDNNGVWRPVSYTGTFGAQGWYLKFDPSATNGIGHDHSGNGNNFTANGFTTSGSGSDIFTDTPTTNESLFNFNQIRWGNGYSLSWGQNAWREFYGGSNGMGWGHFQTINGNSSGKYCWASAGYTEYIGSCLHGVGKYPNSTNTSNGANIPYPRFQLQTNGNFAHTGLTATPSYTNPVASSQSSNPGYFYCWFAWDIDAGKLWVRSSSTDSFPGWNGDPAAGTGAQVTNLYPNPGEDWGHFIYQVAQGGSFYGYSFSGNHFSNFVPDGFTYLNSSAAGTLAITDPGKHFKAVTYTGTSASNSITGVGFQPDLVWIKGRSNTTNHVLVDSVRGATEVLESDSTAAETTDVQSLTSFDSDGFTLGTSNDVNNSAVGFDSYVAWCWKAGGPAVANTAGTITSQVSANQEAGFSIVNFTGSGANATVGHGLSQTPEMMIVKNRDVGNTGWIVYHKDANSSPETGGLRLNLTDAFVTYSLYWNDTAPDSTVFTVGAEGQVNGNGSGMIAYCFAEVEGYSKFGSYIGNGLTDGPFVYLGFKPSLLIIKRTNSTENWLMFDNARETYNPTDDVLWANLANAESANYTPQDFLSNGFKIRTSSTSTNGSGSTYMFMAFAESPSGGNNVSPATAR